MLKTLILNILLICVCGEVSKANIQTYPAQQGTQINYIDSLNQKAYNIRLSDPEQTITIATKAYEKAKKVNDLNRLAEACRVIGIGQYYLSKYEEALDKYLEAISHFEQINNLKGVGKVYNNIGNLYLLNNYDKALEYYNKSLAIEQKYGSKSEVAGLYVNIGIIQMKKKKFVDALEQFQISLKLFKQLNDPVLIIQCMQNIGEAYNNLREYQKAEAVLNEAYKSASAQDLNYTVASIKLTLANVYLSQNKFDQAQQSLQKGFEYAKTLKNRDLQNDYKYAFFQLEYKKGNFKTALQYLKQNFSQDSAYYRQSFSKRISLASDLFNQLENRRKNERLIAQQKYTTTLFWFSTAVAGLLFTLVFLLIINVKKTNKSNKELTHLHKEVSKQKEDLDRINHYLEDIIDERTGDLKIKNKQLSDYSLHLSHHIRGPIATLKGIIYLQQNDLIDQEECIQLIKKCVFNIDDEIISMSKMLNENNSKPDNT